MSHTKTCCICGKEFTGWGMTLGQWLWMTM